MLFLIILLIEAFSFKHFSGGAAPVGINPQGKMAADNHKTSSSSITPHALSAFTRLDQSQQRPSQAFSYKGFGPPLEHRKDPSLPQPSFKSSHGQNFMPAAHNSGFSQLSMAGTNFNNKYPKSFNSELPLNSQYRNKFYLNFNTNKRIFESESTSQLEKLSSSTHLQSAGKQNFQQMDFSLTQNKNYGMDSVNESRSKSPVVSDTQRKKSHHGYAEAEEEEVIIDDSGK